MTDNEHKLIERGHDNDMLALLEWVRLNKLLVNMKWIGAKGAETDAQLLERFKNRDK